MSTAVPATPSPGAPGTAQEARETMAHAASTPIALPTGEPSPLVDIPAGSVRGVWRRVVGADGSPGTLEGTGDRVAAESAPPRPGSTPLSYSRSAAFYAIPYAEDPIGERRLMAPVRRARWEGLRDATAPGPTPQRRPFAEVTAVPEPSVAGREILNLNVFTPAPGETGALLPVLVWIHGGGFYAGSHNSPYYDGAAFNRDGVVTVSISYRLGLDGFGWVPDSDAPVNRGLLDQVMALEWVRDNIAGFGGDPGRVTIAGHSAGGASVMALLDCPRACGLFHRAICQSGGIITAGVEDARAVAVRGAEVAGITPDLAGWRSLSEEQVLDVEAELRGRTPMFDIAPAEEPARGPRLPQMSARAFSPVVDGEIISAATPDAVRSGASAGVPLLMGAVRHELTAMGAALAARLEERIAARPGAGLTGPGPASEPSAPASDEPAEHRPRLLDRTGLPPVLVRRLREEHPELAGREELEAGQFISSALLHLPMLGLAQLRAADAPAAERTWLYDFSWGSTLPGASHGLAGHCQELPFVFDCLAHPHADAVQGPGRPQALADLIHADWVRFICQGEPGWRPWADSGLGRVYGGRAAGQGALDRTVYGLELAILDAARGGREGPAAPTGSGRSTEAVTAPGYTGGSATGMGEPERPGTARGSAPAGSAGSPAAQRGGDGPGAPSSGGAGSATAAGADPAGGAGGDTRPEPPRPPQHSRRPHPGPAQDPHDRLLLPAPDGPAARAVAEILELRMPDGTVLRADVVRPDDQAPHPVLLARCPYFGDWRPRLAQAAGRDPDSPGLMAVALGMQSGVGLDRAIEEGFAVVAQACRGTDISEGAFRFHADEAADGVATRRALAELEWCDGRVITFGHSYLTTTQFTAALASTEHLAAMDAWVSPSTYDDDLAMRGGVLLEGPSYTWARQQVRAGLAREGRPDVSDCALPEEPEDFAPVLRRAGIATAARALAASHSAGAHLLDWLAHPLHDEYWESVGYSRRALADLQVPALHVAGWYDLFLGGTLRNYSAMAAGAARRGRAGDVRLVIGPWTHLSFDGALEGRSFPDGGTDGAGLGELTLDIWRAALGDAEASDRLPQDPVRVYIMGSGWVDLPSWPAPGARPTSWRLSDAGTLLPPDDPRGQAGWTSWSHDPADPVPTCGGQLLMGPPQAAGPHDQRAIEARDDVAVFTSPPLRQAVTVLGHVRLHAWVSADAADAHLHASLTDVAPDGASTLLTDGVLRLSARASLDRRDPLEPGRLVEVEVDMWATGIRLPAGHRIGLNLAGSCWPRYCVADPADGRAVQIMVAHDRNHPSELLLPLLEPAPRP